MHMTNPNLSKLCRQYFFNSDSWFLIILTRTLFLYQTLFLKFPVKVADVCGQQTHFNEGNSTNMWHWQIIPFIEIAFSVLYQSRIIYLSRRFYENTQIFKTIRDPFHAINETLDHLSSVRENVCKMQTQQDRISTIRHAEMSDSLTVEHLIEGCSSPLP